MKKIIVVIAAAVLSLALSFAVSAGSQVHYNGHPVAGGQVHYNG